MSNAPIISIVDDDEAVGTAVAGLVRSLGFRARRFSSAAGFLHWSGRADTACLISDVQMPEMDGVQLQAQLAATGDSTPIMFMTAHPDERVEMQVMKAGAVCVLIKPFNLDLLEKYLQESVRRKAQRTPAASDHG